MGQPTPLWAQRLSPDGTRLLERPTEIMRNDAAWEAQLVEGAFIMRRGGRFYNFYSGNACCGRECNYALGVARARKLLGPWETHPANPILKGNEAWKCPGHGSLVATPDGRGASDARRLLAVQRKLLHQLPPGGAFIYHAGHRPQSSGLPVRARYLIQAQPRDYSSSAEAAVGATRK